MNNFLRYFNKQGSLFFILLGSLLSIIIGFIDYVTLDFFVFEFYLLPVALAVWFSGKKAGILVAVVSTLTETILDVVTSPYHSSRWVHYSNFLLNLGFFIAIVYALDFLKKTLIRLENTSESERIINRQLRSEIEYRKLLEVEIKKNQEELKKLAITDSLTGLYNRRGFLSLGQQQLKLAKRIKQGVGLIYADLDNFKSINDAFGHKTGDLALIEAAGVFKMSFRESDIVARIGGDEFAVFTVQPHKDSGNVLIGRLQDNLDKSNARAGRNHKLSLSIGVVYCEPEYPRSIDELLSEADKAMFREKQARKSP